MNYFIKKILQINVNTKNRSQEKRVVLSPEERRLILLYCKKDLDNLGNIINRNLDFWYKNELY